MCGIAGFIDFNKKLSINDIIQMTSSISHRGPDNLGKYFEEHENFSVGLGHARLSIIDLSVSADQPMFFENYVLVFNGEIYNYAEIKQTLISKGHIFVTNSDTEIIIHAFKEWGIDCVDSFIGMFSICIYDKLKSKIYLIRDRVGVKPLYFFNDGNKFLFSSELKSFYCLVDFEKNIDLTALSLYFQFGYVPAPKTIFKNCFKLKPGHILEFDLCDKSIKDINNAEAALLASLPKAPSKYNPYRNFNTVKGRKDWVLKRMEDNGFISKEELQKSLNYKLNLQNTNTPEMSEVQKNILEYRKRLQEEHNKRMERQGRPDLINKFGN